MTIIVTTDREREEIYDHFSTLANSHNSLQTMVTEAKNIDMALTKAKGLTRPQLLITALAENGRWIFLAFHKATPKTNRYSNFTQPTELASLFIDPENREMPKQLTQKFSQNPPLVISGSKLQKSINIADKIARIAETVVSICCKPKRPSFENQQQAIKDQLNTFVPATINSIIHAPL